MQAQEISTERMKVCGQFCLMHYSMLSLLNLQGGPHVLASTVLDALLQVSSLVRWESTMHLSAVPFNSSTSHIVLRAGYKWPFWLC